MKINYEKTKQNIVQHETLCYHEITDLAVSIIEYINYEFDDVCDAVCDAIDNQLIYCEDQWKIVHTYINPDEIGRYTFQELVDNFINDLIWCIVTE